MAIVVRHYVVAIIVVTAILAAACGNPDTGPIGILPGKWDGGDDALYEGILRLEDGCLLIDNGRWPLLLALHRDGVSWNDERMEMSVAGKTDRVGETISIGGGGGGRQASEIEWEIPPAENVGIIMSGS